MLLSSHSQRERERERGTRLTDLKDEKLMLKLLFFFFKLSPLTLTTGLGDDVPPAKMQSAGELHFLLEKSQFNLGLSHMYPGYLSRLSIS